MRALKFNKLPFARIHKILNDLEDADDENLAEEEKPPMSFDQTLSDIGFGFYQRKAYFILGMILVFDGAEAIVLSLVQNILEKEWSLSPFENNLVGTAVFTGFLIGSLISGKISDLYGRRKPLLYLVPMLYIVGVLSAFINRYIIFLITRAVYGILVGAQFPICFTYLTEITPKERRGRYLIIAGAFFTIGELYACLIAFFTLDDVSSGNWRLMVFIVAQPALLCWFGLKYVVQESPRYLMVVKRDHYKSIEILEKIATQNDANVLLKEEDIKALSKWVELNDNLQMEETGKVSTLFSRSNRRITIFIWPVWFVLCLSYYGMVYILPKIVEALDTSLHGDGLSLWSIILPSFGELFSVGLGYMAIERSRYGRKGSMIAGFLVTAVLCLLATIAPFFTLWITIARMTLNMVFMVASPYTAELYPTNIRATGLGMASAFSRIGGALTTWFSQFLFYVNVKLPFLGFGGLCLVGAACCSMIPYDTTNKELDVTDEKESKEKS